MTTDALACHATSRGRPHNSARPGNMCESSGCGGRQMFEGLEPIEFEHDGTLLRGYAAVPDGAAPRPAVLVMHSAVGIAHGVNESMARRLAEHGYLAVCTDMYGANLEGASRDQFSRAFEQNLAEPEMQRERAVAWFDAVAAREDVDHDRIAAVGFCYGGLTVLELARAGANLKLVVSYHGDLRTHAKAERGAIRAHVIAYCGASDPYAPLNQVDALRQELVDAEVKNYQITVFGHAAHGFTDPDAADLNLDGVEYNDLANEISWSGTLILLHHLLVS
jgi:dienelactone hydrolase